jgi:chemotaxis protein methyltransferase CheR
MIAAIAGLGEEQTLAQAIVNTIHEPLIVLDADRHVLAASRSFYDTFEISPQDAHGRLLFTLGDGQWDMPRLRLLLETIISESQVMDGFEITHDFPKVGRRTMLLNARKVHYDTKADVAILVAFTDVTEQRAIEQAKTTLHEQTERLLIEKRVLLQEMEHRVANSLQIIASILMMKARLVTSEETRRHLRDAHQRVMSVSSVQSHLHATEGIDQVEVGVYLTKLCESLSVSMIGEEQSILLAVAADKGRIGSAQAVSMGLIVTELVINALKYAFPEKVAGSAIQVTYESRDEDWRLSVSDNGVGSDKTISSGAAGGLGTVIVEALAKQLGARIDSNSSAAGLNVTFTRASFTSAPAAV